MEAKDFLDDGASALKFELVWAEIGDGGWQVLLNALCVGDIQAEGIFVQGSNFNDRGKYQIIDREDWVMRQHGEINTYIERFGKLSLSADEDETGYGNILLKRSDALLEVLSYVAPTERTNVEASDIAWYKANSRYFGHAVTTLAQALLWHGVVPASAKQLADKLHATEGVWKAKAPEYETTLKFCLLAVKAHNKAKSMLIKGF